MYKITSRPRSRSRGCAYIVETPTRVHDDIRSKIQMLLWEKGEAGTAATHAGRPCALTQQSRLVRNRGMSSIPIVTHALCRQDELSLVL